VGSSEHLINVTGVRICARSLHSKSLEWLSLCEFSRRSTETIRMFALGNPPGVVRVQVWTPSLSKGNDLFPL
jgi:hypothetical protein